MFTQPILSLLSEQFLLFLILITRFTVTFSTLSFFRKEMVPVKITILFSIALTLFLLVYGVLGEQSIKITSERVFLDLMVQAFLGFLTGFILNVFIDIFLALGQIVSVQSGLGFVNLFIPKVGTITPLSQFFFIVATLIFFELNGHLILIKMIVDSFKMHLLDVKSINLDVVKEVIQFVKIIFSGSLMLSLSLLIAVLIANITIATMTKFSPQLNIFSIGITISLIISFFMLYIGFDAILANGRILLNDNLYWSEHWIKRAVN